MFSPVGKKQILLEIKRAKETGLDLQEAREIVLARKQDELNEKSMGSPGAQVSPDKSKRSTAGKKDEDGMGTSKLNQLLSDKGLEGTVMRKVMDATVRYNPEKDQIVLKSFQNKFIEPELFRDILYKAFWLGFNDKEFNAMLDILDPSDSGYIDGYQFMIAFIRLGGIRKEKAAEKIRLGNEAFTIKMKEEEAKKKMELEKKNEIAADFDFDDEVKNQAMKKLTIAASKFDPAHPSSPSLEAFNGKYMSAAVLREMLKRVFNLKVSGKELGAILMHFEAKDLVDAQNKALGVSTAGVQTMDVSDGVKQVTVPASGGGAAEGGKDAETIAVKTGPSQISCNDFLRQFFRLGVETRDKTARKQRQRQLELDKLAAEEKARKVKEADEKKSMAIDFEFSELDVARADTKLLEASTKYDKNAPGCGSLEGFECESLSVGTFRDLVRRTFGLVLSDKELGYVIRKYDKKGDHTITCKPFLNAFLRIGQDERDKRRLKQLEKQRKLDELASLEAEQKMKEIQEKSDTFKINYDFTDADADSAKAKLTEAAVWFDKSRGGSLASFEQLFLSPLEFHRALKRTFNIIMTPAELGAVVTMMDTEGKGHVVSKQFINSFTAMGFQERSSKSLKQIKKSQAAEKKMREEAEAKRLALLNKNPGVDIDYEYNEDDRDDALLKMTDAACRYDKAHPAAMSLDGFECKALTPIAFKDLMRSTFNLRLTPKDAGALIDHFSTLRDGSNEKEIISRDFLTVFLQLGYQQRAALNTEQIQKQRRMLKEQAEREAEMLKKTTERADGLKINMNFVEADAVSCQAKLLGAAKGYDKNHPAAPSLDAFDIAVMPAGIFRENMKRCFNIKLNPSELGYCIVTYGDKQKMEVESPSFLTKFLRMGKTARYEEQTAFLKKQRKMIKEAKYQEEKKLKDQAEGAEFKVDLTDFKDTDLETALDKMTLASTKFHEPMSSVKGFTGGPMKPGEFRDLVRRSFGLALTPQETASLVNYLNADPKNRTSDCLDSKAFCILFMKLGHQNRAAMKNEHIERQRQATQDMEKEKVRKKRLQEQKMVTDIDWGYGEVDRTSVYKKVTEASAKYDKNAPGCVSLTAFEAKFLTPLVFREVMKRTFNIACSPKELAVLVSDFDNGDGNLHCQNFVVYFMKLGAEERNKFKLIMLEKQRRDNEVREAEQERKLRELKDKTSLKVSYETTDGEKEMAFKKLARAAKAFDRNHPGSMDLSGFDAKTLPAGAFREMLKRTFNLVLDGGELGAIMSYFDPKQSGQVVCQDFLIHFLRVGQAERNKVKTANLEKLRQDEIDRKQREADILAAQWAKTELGVTKDFKNDDKQSAIDKLQEAAFKYDSQGSVSLSTFHAKYLSAAVFREMLKRVFNVRMTDKELAALISIYEHEEKEDHIDCRMFMNDFTKLGFEARSSKSLAQISKNRVAVEEEKTYHVRMKQEAENKVANVVDFKYGKQDFQTALEKVTSVAGNYEIGHASAPSLSGFRGANMKPFEFKDMMMRTFSVPLSGKELGALVKYYDSSGSNTVDSKEFLAHFMKLQRQEAEARRKRHIDKERGLKRAEKEREEEIIAVKARAEREKLKFTKEDEKTFLVKIRNAAQEYAIDSATMQEPLQAFKGPALNAVSFIDVCRRIFHGTKFTYPEVGVLLSILDAAGTGTIDGPRFLNWFYKLGRVEGEIMLGERDDDVTMKSLRAGAASATEDPGKVKVELKPFNQAPSKKSNSGKSSNNASGVVLPAAAAARAQPTHSSSSAPALFDAQDGMGGPESAQAAVAANAAGPRGGKKLAMLLMSDKGKHVGGKALNASTDVVVPSLPAAAGIKGGARSKLSKSASMDSSIGGKKSKGASGSNKKREGQHDSLTRAAQESQRKIDPKHMDVSENKEASGKVSKGTMSDSAAAPTASGGGFFFPTLLAGASNTGGAEGVPNVAPSGRGQSLGAGYDLF